MVTVLVRPHRRVVLWRRNCGWSRRTGSLSFDQVSDVLAESPIGDEGIASRRLSLMVAAGGTLSPAASQNWTRWRCWRPHDPRVPDDRPAALARMAHRGRTTWGLVRI